MAEIEEGEHGDKGRVREWLARAVRAPRDPAWVADGIVSESWAPVSPVSGRIDAFQWRVPVERIGAPEGRDEDEELMEAAPPGSIVEVPAAAEAREQEAAAVRPAAKTAAEAPAPRQRPAAEPAAGRPPKAAESSGPPGDGAAAVAVAESPEAAQTGEDRVEPPPAAPAPSAKPPPARKGDAKVTASDDATAAVTEKAPEKAEKTGDKATEAAAPRPPDDPGPEHSGLDDEDAAYRRS
jgi:HemY protein